MPRMIGSLKNKSFFAKKKALGLFLIGQFAITGSVWGVTTTNVPCDTSHLYVSGEYIKITAADGTNTNNPTLSIAPGVATTYSLTGGPIVQCDSALGSYNITIDAYSTITKTDSGNVIDMANATNFNGGIIAVTNYGIITPYTDDASNAINFNLATSKLRYAQYSGSTGNIKGSSGTDALAPISTGSNIIARDVYNLSGGNITGNIISGVGPDYYLVTGSTVSGHITGSTNLFTGDRIDISSGTVSGGITGSAAREIINITGGTVGGATVGTGNITASTGAITLSVSGASTSVTGNIVGSTSTSVSDLVSSTVFGTSNITARDAYHLSGGIVSGNITSGVGPDYYLIDGGSVSGLITGSTNSISGDRIDITSGTVSGGVKGGAASSVINITGGTVGTESIAASAGALTLSVSGSSTIVSGNVSGSTGTNALASNTVFGVSNITARDAYHLSGGRVSGNITSGVGPDYYLIDGADVRGNITGNTTSTVGDRFDVASGTVSGLITSSHASSIVNVSGSGTVSGGITSGVGGVTINVTGGTVGVSGSTTTIRGSSGALNLNITGSSTIYSNITAGSGAITLNIAGLGTPTISSVITGSSGTTTPLTSRSVFGVSNITARDAYHISRGNVSGNITSGIGPDYYLIDGGTVSGAITGSTNSTVGDRVDIAGGTVSRLITGSTSSETINISSGIVSGGIAAGVGGATVNISGGTVSTSAITGNTGLLKLNITGSPSSSPNISSNIAASNGPMVLTITGAGNPMVSGATITGSTGSATTTFTFNDLSGVSHSATAQDIYHISSGTISSNFVAGTTGPDYYFIEGGTINGTIAGSPLSDTVYINNGTVGGKITAGAGGSTINIHNGIVSGGIQGDTGATSKATEIINISGGIVRTGVISGGTGLLKLNITGSPNISSSVAAGAGPMALTIAGTPIVSGTTITGSTGSTGSTTTTLTFNDLSGVSHSATAQDIYHIAGGTISSNFAAGTTGPDYYFIEGGTINGTIAGSPLSDTVYINNGTVNGRITAGSGGGAININGGIVSGGIQCGLGNESITINGGVVKTGVITGGAGTLALTIQSGAQVSSNITPAVGAITLIISGNSTVNSVIRGSAGTATSSSFFGKTVTATDGYHISGGVVSGSITGGTGQAYYLIDGGVVNSSINGSSNANGDRIDITAGTVAGSIIAGSGGGQINVSGGIVNGGIQCGAGSETINITGGSVRNNSITGGAGALNLNISSGSVSSAITPAAGAITLIISGNPTVNSVIRGSTSTTTSSSFFGKTVTATDGYHISGGNVSGSITGGTGQAYYLIDGGVVNSSISGGSNANGDRIDITAGTVVGRITAGSGGGAINVSGGVVKSNVQCGAGNESINISSGTFSGTVAGGAGDVTLNIKNSPTVSGYINLNSTAANVLNIGSSSGDAAIFSTGNNIVNAQTIHVYAQSSGSTNAFTINNNLTGVNSFIIDSRATATVARGGDVSGGSIGAISNSGTFIVNTGGTVGNLYQMGNVTNNGIFTASGSSIKVGAFVNDNTSGTASNPAFKLTSGNMTVSGTFTNSNGYMKISGGDLSSYTSASSLINNQTITVTSGSIGSNNPLGTVTNNGTFAVSGGAVTVGEFDNSLAAAALTITGGNVATTGNINNNLGSITISGGDLSSASTIIASASNLTNATGQIITISGSGSLGANNPLGTVTNYGTIRVSGGAVTVGEFDNGSATVSGGPYTGALTISGGNVATGNINNHLGSITISGGDLSSASTNAANASNLTNYANQTLTLSNSGSLGGNQALGTITNYGIFNVSGTDTVINASAIELYNDMTISGTINAPINLHTNPTTLLPAKLYIGDATLTNLITGISGDASTINIVGSFISSQVINNVKTIHVMQNPNDPSKYGNFTVNNFITTTSDGRLNNDLGCSVTVNNVQGGNISGGGTIQNDGTFTLNTAQINGVILGSSNTDPMGNVTNTGTFNVKAGTAYVGTFTNTTNSTALLNITEGVLQTGNITNTKGSITISNGDLSSIGSTASTLINGATTDVLGSLQSVTISGGTVGANGALGSVTNSGIFNVEGGNTVVGDFANNNTVNQTNASLNVSGGIVTTGLFTNTSGAITISGGVMLVGGTPISGNSNIMNTSGAITISGGDLSSASINTPSSLKNTAGQTITVSSFNGGGNTVYGTIGVNGALGDITNNGKFIASGGAINVGAFTNNNTSDTPANPAFKITSGNMVVSGTVTNTAGHINISGGDLSSAFGTVSNLINAANQTITVAGGSIGANVPIGTVTNYGTVAVSAGAVTVGEFDNGSATASGGPYTGALTISGGNVATGNINNNLGSITVSSGDLSGAGISGGSTLINAADQTVTISGGASGGTIGAYQALGGVTNNGMFIASGGAINVGAFTNNNTTTAGLNVNNPAFKITSGNMAVSGTVTNTAGFMTISGGDLSSTVASALINSAGQTIKISSSGVSPSIVYGTIGAYGALGAVTNNGKFIANGGAIHVGSFTNNNSSDAIGSEAFQLISGSMTVSDTITNTAGHIKISGGDLSSAIGTISDLTNATGQTITVTGGSIGGAVNGALGTVTNNGTFVVNGGNVSVSEFDNGDLTNNYIGALTITSGNVATGNVNNNLGNITISGGDLSSAPNTISNLTNAAGQTITVSSSGVSPHIVYGTIGNVRPLGNITNNGMFVASGGAISVGAFTNNNTTTQGLSASNPAFSITSGNMVVSGTVTNTAGFMTISGGDLSSASGATSNLVNVAGQTITISSSGASPNIIYGTIGTNVNGSALGSVTNNGTFIASGGAVNIGSFTNDNTSGTASNPAFSLISGNMTISGTITNTAGFMTISGGDLSSHSGATSNLVNAVGQTITVSGGSIGGANNGALSVVANKGTINVNGGNITVGNFNNNSTNASLNINNSNSLVKTGNINNTLGSIIISRGDLSSAASASTLTNAVGQTIKISGGSIGNAAPFGVITNSGTLIVSSGTLSASSITQAGIMMVAGTINSPIQFPANSNSGLIINAGAAINGDITGDQVTGVGNSIEINLGNNNVFSINPTVAAIPPTPGSGCSISYVGSIKVDSGTFNVNNAISNVDNNLTVAAGAKIIVGRGGTIAGNGIINNEGNITVNGNNSTSVSMGSIINNNTVFNTGSVPTLKIQHGQVTADRVTNVYGGAIGGIVISSSKSSYVCDLSSRSPSELCTVVNAANQNITVSGYGTMGMMMNSPIGAVTNFGSINFSGGNVRIGDFTNDNANAYLNITSGIVKIGNIINNFGSTIGSIKISGGDLSSVGTASTLTNSVGQTIAISGNGTVGANGALGSITNKGIINAGGGNITVGDFTNSNNASLNISSGIVTTGVLANISGNVSILDGIVKVGGTPSVGGANITNVSGAITISGGDLSSASSIMANASSLINSSGQTITVSGLGTIGANNALGGITNNGTINANGGNITVGSFVNNNVNATLNITSGVVRTGNISNTLSASTGGIIISGGDLSSNGISGNSALTNAIGQIITVSHAHTITGATVKGTIGANGAFGVVTNNGIINAGGGNITVGDFNNNNNAQFNVALNDSNDVVTLGKLNNISGNINISSGKVKVSDVINTSGIITISGGDLSGVGVSGSSTLTNAAGQSITVSGSGRIGTTNALGAITNNGTFNINAPITTADNIVKIIGAFTNNANAIVNLGANIDIGGNGYTFINDGTVNMLRTVNLNGNYTVSATDFGTHVVNINNDGVVSVLNVNHGSITLNSNSVINVNFVGDPLIQDQQSFTVMSVNNGVINKGNNITVNGATDLVSYTLEVRNNNLELVARRKSITGIMGLTSNMEAITIAKVLDDLFTKTLAGDLKIALAKLEGLATQQEVIDAITQLSPETNVISEIGFVGSGMVFGTIGERTDLIARAGIDNVRTGYAAGGMQATNGVWIKGLGGSINQQQRLDSAGYIANAAGFAFGIDSQIVEDAWLGVGFSSVGTHVNGKDISGNKTNVSSRQVTVYGSYSPIDYYIDGFAAMAFNNYKLTRNIQYNGLNQTAVADYNAKQPSVKVATGYIYGFNNGFRIVPNLSLQYSVLNQNSYNETGAGGLSLQQVTSSSLTQLEGGVGVKFAVLNNEDYDQTYNPDVHFMVLHDFKSSAQTTTAQFLGGGGNFTVQGVAPSKKTYNVGFGLTFIHKDRLHFTVNYDLRKKNKYVGHSGSLAVRYEI